MHSSKRDWESVYNFINKGSYFVLTTHVNPDGDAIGSEMAIYYYLQNIGKKAVILNCSPTPKYYRFLDPHNRIQQFCKEHEETLEQGGGP